jgi:hypothetical protein
LATALAILTFASLAQAAVVQEGNLRITMSTASSLANPPHRSGTSPSLWEQGPYHPCLKRKYRFKGQQLSYFNSGCPAPKGAPRTVFSLALAELYFAEGVSLSARVEKACGVRG